MAEMRHKTITLYEEPCDCLERHGRIMHDNGGNYHEVARLHVYYDGAGDFVVVIEETDTREHFPRDEMAVLVRDGRHFRVLEKADRDWRVENMGHDLPVIDRFRDGDATIIA